MKLGALAFAIAAMLTGHAAADPLPNWRAPPPHAARSSIELVSGYVNKLPRRAERSDVCASAVGRFRLGIGGQGTGAIALDPRIVLTNAHVVVRDGKVRPRVVFELPDGQVDYIAHWGTVAAQGTRYPDLDSNWANDWAIVVLDAAAPVRPLRILFDAAEEAVPGDPSLFAIGYSRFPAALPGSGDFFAVVSEQCAVRATRAGMLLHDCSTMDGGSGSPIMVQRGNYCSIVGLHRGTMTPISVEQIAETPDHLNYAVAPARFKSALAAVVEQLRSGRWNVE